MKFCPNCGAAIADHGKFCARCGSALPRYTENAVLRLHKADNDSLNPAPASARISTAECLQDHAPLSGLAAGAQDAFGIGSLLTGLPQEQLAALNQDLPGSLRRNVFHKDDASTVCLLRSDAIGRDVLYVPYNISRFSRLDCNVLVPPEPVQKPPKSDGTDGVFAGFGQSNSAGGSAGGTAQESYRGANGGGSTHGFSNASGSGGGNGGDGINPYKTNTADGGAGWFVIGLLLFPFLSLILYYISKRENPDRAKSIKSGLLTGLFLLPAIIIISMFTDTPSELIVYTIIIVFLVAAFGVRKKLRLKPITLGNKVLQNVITGIITIVIIFLIIITYALI